MATKTIIEDLSGRDLLRNAQTVFAQIIEGKTTFRIMRYGVPVAYLLSVPMFLEVTEKKEKI